MMPKRRSTNAERAGAWLGRAWRRLLRAEQAFAAWLVTRGMSAAAAKAAIWGVRLAVVGVAAYSFTAAAAIVAGAFIFCMLRDVDLPPDEPPEWRTGLQGFGLYDRDGFRIDPHDPTDPNDVE